MALVLGLGLVFIVGGALHDLPPPTNRVRRNYDAPTRFGIAMMLIWAMICIAVGVWVEPKIFVANWYYLTFILALAMLRIVNQLALPMQLTSAESFPIWSGVQDAMV